MSSKVFKGVKFTSCFFSATCEVEVVRPKMNEVDIILVPSDNHCWRETWKLDETEKRFIAKQYKEIGAIQQSIIVSGNEIINL